MIAVTGATGFVGARVATRLAERGAPMRLLVRDPARAPALPGADVRRIGGYGAGEDVREALAGADTLFLLPAHESAGRVTQHRGMVEAAVAAGLGRIVYLSFAAAAPDATFTLARDHWATEEEIKATPLRWTFARMNLYMDFVPQLMADGVIRGPAGDGRAAAVLREDVAAAVAALLVEGGHDGRTYELTGPSAFSMAEAAAALSRATGRTIRFEDETEEQAYASRAGYGAPDWQVEAWVTTYLAIREGSMAPVSPHVRELTGRDPVPLDEFLERERRAAAG